MSIDLSWHVAGKLSIKAMFPENGGSMLLADGDDVELRLYLSTEQWWTFYCTLPKHAEFRVHVAGDAPSIRDHGKAHLFLCELADKKEAA